MSRRTKSKGWRNHLYVHEEAWYRTFKRFFFVIHDFQASVIVDALCSRSLHRGYQPPISLRSISTFLFSLLYDSLYKTFYKSCIHLGMPVRAGAVTIGICMINCRRLLPLPTAHWNFGHHHDLPSKNKWHQLLPECTFEYESSHAANLTQSQAQDPIWVKLRKG